MKRAKTVFVVSAIGAAALGVLASSIVERKYEAKQGFVKVNEIKSQDPKSINWKNNFPYQYESYKKTKDGVVGDDELKKIPALPILWAGYGFSKSYRAPRGHDYTVVDILETLRTGAPEGPKDGPMPNTCWSCKSPDVPRVMKEEGVAEFYKGKWASRGKQVVNPIGCADCHDSKTMALTITRPALVEAFERQGKDISKVSYQEKKSLVCAQCHVEYYFKGKDKYLTFPWDNGDSAEAMEKYYDNLNFKDWTHKLSRAPMLKAQHPGYEMWKKGIHGKRGVSCTDCHMPYKADGGVKYTDHHIQSPLKNVNNACQTCHRQSENDLLANVADLKSKFTSVRKIAERELVKAHLEAEIAWKNGATEEMMKDVLKYIRHSQWRWDYSVASHGAYFHAPEEALRLLSTSVDKAKEARIHLERIFGKLGVKTPVSLPDVSTKAKAQKHIGLDVEALKKAKKKFLKRVEKDWAPLEK